MNSKLLQAQEDVNHHALDKQKSFPYAWLISCTFHLRGLLGQGIKTTNSQAAGGYDLQVPSAMQLAAFARMLSVAGLKATNFETADTGSSYQLRHYHE
jgi:hypothetical protein